MSRVPIRTEREKDIQKTILEGLSALRIWHMRTNSGAMFAEYGGKKRMLRFGRKGMADVLAIPVIPVTIVGITRLEMRPTWIEVKRPGESQTFDQRLFQDEVESEGHKYAVVTCWEEALKAIQEV